MPPAVIGGVIAGVGAIGGAAIASSGAKSAANAQAAANDRAIAAQQAQQAQMRSDLAPWTNAGNSALEQQMALLGLGGKAAGAVDWAKYVNGTADALAQWQTDPNERAKWNNDIAAFGQFHWNNDGRQRDLTPYTSTGTDGSAVQASAIEQLKASPLYQSLFRNGEQAILQNASATGGLRGGNTQASLANFGRDTLASVIENQLNRLGGVSTAGQNSAAMVGNAGQNSANNISQLLNNTGAAQGNAAYTTAGAMGGAVNTIAGALSSALSQNNTNSLLSSVKSTMAANPSIF